VYSYCKVHLENERTRLGERFFDLLASWEPLVVGYVVSLEHRRSMVVSDPQDDLGFTFLYNSVLKKWKQELHVAEDAIELLIEVNPNHELHRHLALEFIGIQKMFGHPFLSVEEGISDIKTQGTEILPCDESIVEDAVGMFKYLFCKNYYSKHQIWPNCYFKKTHSPLKKHYEQRSWPSKGDMRKLTYKAFKEVEFEKTLDFDYNDVTPELLKDSALAPLRKHWYTYGIQ